MNLYMVKKNKRIYSILSDSKEEALKLNGRILDQVYYGLDEESVDFRWENW